VTVGHRSEGVDLPRVDESAATALAFWTRARTFFDGHGIPVERELTDNGSAYRSHAWRDGTPGSASGTPAPGCGVGKPTAKSNGSTALCSRSGPHKRLYTSEKARRAALSGWLHHCNHHRPHTALGNLPPITRCTNVTGQYS
jgi:transposase InsO family protein